MLPGRLKQDERRYNCRGSRLAILGSCYEHGRLGSRLDWVLRAGSTHGSGWFRCCLHATVKSTPIDHECGLTVDPLHVVGWRWRRCPCTPAISLLSQVIIVHDQKIAQSTNRWNSCRTRCWADTRHMSGPWRQSAQLLGIAFTSLVDNKTTTPPLLLNGWQLHLESIP